MASLLAASRVHMYRAWDSYCDQLVKRPLATKILTGVVGTVIGDGLAQGSAYLAQRRAAALAKPRSRPPAFKYDAAHAVRLCLYAAVVGTPIGHYWFAFLDKHIFPHRMGHPLTALAKMGLDQALMAPAGLALFYVCISVMEGKRLETAVDVVRDKFVPTMAANYLLWPAANYINFRFIPPEQRILYVNAVYVGWASFLSTMAASEGPSSAMRRTVQEPNEAAATGKGKAA